MAKLFTGTRQDAMVRMYGAMNQETAQYIQNRIDNLTNLYGSQIESFQQNVQSSFNTGALREINIAKQNLESTNGMFSNSVTIMNSFQDFREASLTNQRYMLAHPYIQKEYQSGRIEGWQYKEDQYKHLQGKDNPYYQQATEGMVQYAGDLNNDSEDDIIEWYLNDEVEQLPELDMREQIIIHRNWDTLVSLLNQIPEDDEPIEDPTSISGAYL